MAPRVLGHQAEMSCGAQRIPARRRDSRTLEDWCSAARGELPKEFGEAKRERAGVAGTAGFARIAGVAGIAGDTPGAAGVAGIARVAGTARVAGVAGVAPAAAASRLHATNSNASDIKGPIFRIPLSPFEK